MAQQEYTFDIEISSNQEIQDTLIVGLSNIGMAGLTAADYLVRNSNAEQIGYISPDDLPAITPFANGEPRHHTRLYQLPDSGMTVLLGELFIPVTAARSFTSDLLDWVSDAEIENIAVLSGIPYPHGPADRQVFHISTSEYRDHYLDQIDLPPLTGGFLDGVPGEIISHALEDSSPPVGVFITPSHPPGPDVNASLRFLKILQTIYGLSVELDELEELSREYQRYYTELADRLQTIDDSTQSIAEQEYPENRMYY